MSECKSECPSDDEDIVVGYDDEERDKRLSTVLTYTEIRVVQYIIDGEREEEKGHTERLRSSRRCDDSGISVSATSVGLGDGGGTSGVLKRNMTVDTTDREAEGVDEEMGVEGIETDAIVLCFLWAVIG
ncbi:hypothetical protein EW146_g5787 [Bondarzewia mesenterica]|uniref:Uncharacterized protein n=1 Tax=Bondarzewia mesenterica TaxID=1095465 RepID=A0A4S4LQF6_9AGAM|nr:hypothetical protein EW146_g5787 [Bondarzewia mesenterica]